MLKGTDIWPSVHCCWPGSQSPTQTLSGPCQRSVGTPRWGLWRHWLRSRGHRRRTGHHRLGSIVCPCPPQASLALHTPVPGTWEGAVTLGLHTQYGSLSCDRHPWDLHLALCPGCDSCHPALGPGALTSKWQPCRVAHMGDPPH